MREVLSGRGLREKTQTPFIPYRIPTGVPMRVGFGICQGSCKDWPVMRAGGANHFLSVSSASTTARGATTRTEVMRAGSNMGPGGQGEGGAQWAWT